MSVVAQIDINKLEIDRAFQFLITERSKFAMPIGVAIIGLGNGEI